MQIPDLAIISVSRGLVVPSGSSLVSLRESVGEVSPQETSLAAHWKALTGSIPQDAYPEYIADELKRMLEIRNNVTMPIPISLLGTKSKQRILAYFYMYGYKIQWPDKSWTPDQQAALDFKAGCLVVNAGPGTGKTTAANERAIRLYREMQAAGSNSGVIIISYTNEAINENYRRLHEYGGTRGVLGKKDWDKRINVCTADSLATRIVGRSTDLSYDTTVREAIDKLNTDPSVLTRFYLTGQGMMYSHIIVDECQDIDDNRGELILTFYNKIRVKSLALFGDPRQRLKETAGKWYSSLWERAATDASITRIGFTHTFRFQNQQMMTLVNTLSQRRPSIHHELVTLAADHSVTPIVIHGAEEGYEDMSIRKIGQTILEQRVLGQWAVIGPSLEKDNMTSQFARQIFESFKRMGIPCYTRADGSYRPNAVLFTTIHSAKGKEFDNVITFGMNAFPDSFGVIPHEEGESLIYVLHSRARKRIFYLTHKAQFTPPRGVPASLIEVSAQGPILVQNSFAKEPRHVAIGVKTVAEDHGFSRLMSTNMFTLVTTPLEKLFHPISKPPAGVDKGFWGELLGMGVQEFMSPRSLLSQITTPRQFTMRAGDYASKIRTGEIIDGRDENGDYITPQGKNDEIISREVAIGMLERGAASLSTQEWIEICRLLDFMSSGVVSFVPPVAIELTDAFQRAAAELVERFGSGLAEWPCSHQGVRGFIDILTEDYVIELKTSGAITDAHCRQAWIYNCLLPRPRRVIVVALTTGQITEVTSAQHPLRWQHLLASFFTLYCHSHIMNARLTELIKKGATPVSLPPTSYYVDTEFTIPAYAGGTGEIFEIAAINGEDIFRSLIQTVNIANPEAAADWLDLPEELFENSPSLSHVQTIFWNSARLTPGQPVLNYYHAPMDVSWGAGTASKNMGTALRQWGIRTGTYLGGTAPPKLGEIYSLLVTPLEFQPHLRAHTAVTDALMLMELARYGFA